MFGFFPHRIVLPYAFRNTGTFNVMPVFAGKWSYSFYHGRARACVCVCLTQTIGKYVPKFFLLALSLSSRFLADITSETLSHTDTCTHDHHHPSSIRSMELLKHHIKSMESLNCLKFSDYTFYVVRHVFSISTAFAMD